MALEVATHISQFVTTNPDGNDDRAQGDDHLRMIKQVLKNDLPLPGKFLRSLVKTANYAVLAASDLLSVIRVQAGGVTLSTGVAASVYGDGFSFMISAEGFSVTFDPNGSETVNGLPTVVVPVNSSAIITTDGTKWSAMIGAGITSGVGAPITGGVTLTVADVKQTRVVTDGPSDILLPVSTTVAIGDVVSVKSLTTKRTRVLPQGIETIDGIGSATPVLIPAFECVEFMCAGSGLWIISRQASSFVGEVRPLRHSVLPQGWLSEDGSALDQVLYGGLFARLGTTWNRGDEAAGTFRITNSAGRGLVGDGTGQLVIPFVPANINLAADTIALAGTKATRLPRGTPLVFSLISGIAPVTVPAGILVNGATVYVVETGTDGLIKIASSQANAMVNTAIDFSSIGTGTFSFTQNLSAKALGEYGGEEKHLNNATELAIHNHGGFTGGAGSIAQSGTGYVVGPQSSPGAGQIAMLPSSHSHSIPSDGAANPANNLSPFSVARFMIKA